MTITRSATMTSLGALLALGMTGANAQAPRLVCDEPVHEFGTVEPPDPVRHDFVIRNEGAAPLRIEGVRASCGCVVGKVDKATLQPGEELKISTALPTVGRLGAQHSTMLVVSNDPLRRHFPLVLGRQLRETGFTAVAVYVGGYEAWHRAGLEVERDSVTGSRP